MKNKDREIMEKADEFISFVGENIDNMDPLNYDLVLRIQKVTMIKYIIGINNWMDIYNVKKLVNIGVKTIQKKRSYRFKLKFLKILLGFDGRAD